MIRLGVHISAVAFLGSLLVAGGCATRQPLSPASSQPPVVLVPAGLAGVEDHRAHFRRLFCAVDEELAKTTSQQLSCDEVLLRFGGEPRTVAGPRASVNDAVRTHVAIVHGLGWECLRDLIDPRLLPARHLESLGFHVTEIQVDGLSSSERNAREIRDAVLAMAGASNGEKLVLLGYSKGVVDILVSTATHPGVAQNVDAVISIAGSIGGSPLADEISSDALALVPAVPGARCGIGDGMALQSLRPRVRQQWLATHPLPRSVRYYSLVTAPEPDRVSVAMRQSQRRLSQIDPRNDGALLPQDQLIPGGVLLGYVNADHWAVALPIAGSNRMLGSTVVNRNDFPREAVWEALVRYVDWDLSRRRPPGPAVGAGR